MLHSFLTSPFSDPLRQHQYLSVCSALQGDATAPLTLLLGNIAVEEGGPALDAVVVRPHSITVLVFVPRGGRLSIPALSYGAWKLEGKSLLGEWGTDNPFEQFLRQKEALTTWLASRLSTEQANLQFISGVVMFGAPVTFSPEVEEQLSQHPGGHFQLLGAADQLPRRLKQLARPEIDLSEDDIAQWVNDWEEAPHDASASASQHSAEPEPEPAAGVSPWGRLWRWLGADDIPHDAPYGYSTPEMAANNAEMQHLEKLQREGQAQVTQQLQALEARELERERSMAKLRAQLAQAPPVTSEAQILRERLAVESQEKAAVEEAIRASRAEADARNRNLDAKINQLGQLIEQLNARAITPAPPVAPSASPVDLGTAAALPPLASPAPSLGYRRLRIWRRRLPRIAAVAGIVSLLGLGTWGLGHLGSPSLTPYQENGKWGLADKSGTPVVPAKYSSVGEFKQKRALVELNGAYGLIDATGKEVVTPAYDALNPYAEGYARVRVGDAYTFLDEEGQEFDGYYFNALDFAEGYAAVLDHRGWHYITGPETEDPAHPLALFREAYSFRDGLARVRLADGYTYITKDYLSDPSEGTKPFGRYEQAADFEHGKARVTQGGRALTIDTNGEPVQ